MISITTNKNTKGTLPFEPGVTYRIQGETLATKCRVAVKSKLSPPRAAYGFISDKYNSRIRDLRIQITFAFDEQGKWAKFKNHSVGCLYGSKVTLYENSTQGFNEIWLELLKQVENLPVEKRSWIRLTPSSLEESYIQFKVVERQGEEGTFLTLTDVVLFSLQKGVSEACRNLQSPVTL